MKRGWLMAIIAANLLALVALAFAYPQLMVSPGALTPGHAAIESDCFACHAPLRGAAADRCIACHALPGIGVRTSQGAPLVHPARTVAFHQHLIEQDCMACHSDHAGPKLTHHSRKPFSHALLLPAMRERCDGCHRAPEDTLHRPTAGNCALCHTAERWKPATFEHTRFFVLDKDHNATCITCHTSNDYARYSCYGCHEHEPGKVRAEHEKEGIGNFENCVECHRSGDKESAKQGDRKQRKNGKRD